MTSTRTLTPNPTVTPTSEPGWNVQTVGQLDGLDYGRAVAAENQFAYLGIGSTVVVVNVSNPSAPVIIGGTTIPRVVGALSIQNGYVYATYARGFSSGSLVVVDVHNPYQPVVLGEVSVPTVPHRVVVRGSYAYVVTTAFGPGYLTAVNVSDPMHPIVADTYTGEASYGLALQGNYAYISSNPVGARAGLRVISIANPYDLVGVGTYSVGDSQYFAYDVAISPGYVFVTYRGVNVALVQILSISNPTGPSGRGSFTFPSDGFAELTVDDRYLYIIDEGIWDGSEFVNGCLRVVDGGDKRHPVQVGLYMLPASPQDVVVSGSLVYVLYGSQSSNQGGLRILRFTG